MMSKNTRSLQGAHEPTNPTEVEADQRTKGVNKCYPMIKLSNPQESSPK